MRKLCTVFLALSMALSLAACGGSRASTSSPSGSTVSSQEPVEMMVFAAASMTETMDEIIVLYQSVAPHVTVIPTYDSSGTLLKQLQEGADCDLFISAAQKQMNALDGSLIGDVEKNPDSLDLIDTTTRLNLLENEVTLVVPAGNPKGIQSFDGLAKDLSDGKIFMAIGNSDVPVGQYTHKIFAYYGLDEAALNAAGVLTYGSNVKEVTTQVAEGTVDCGVIYATDAHSEGLTVVDSATAEMCGQVTYPAAVLKNSTYPDEAQAFLAYLTAADASAVFQSVGFTPLG